MCQTCGCAMTPGNAHLRGDREVRRQRGDRRAAGSARRQRPGRERTIANTSMSTACSPSISCPRRAPAKPRCWRRRSWRSRDRYRIAVIEGDLETDNDAARIRAHGVPALQITTGTACHLDAHLVHRALHDLPLAGLDLLFIENVGNLVCPASFDLGQHRNVTLLSVTEGDDKPAKYPGDVPRRRSGGAEQDGPARRAGRFRSGARSSGAARARPRHADDPHRRAARPGDRPVAGLAGAAAGGADGRSRTVPRRGSPPRRSGPDACAWPFRYESWRCSDDQWVEIEVGGIRSRVSIALIDEVAVGDYVIVHAGFAIARLDVEEAEKTLALFDEIAAHLREPADALHPRLP